MTTVVTLLLLVNFWSHIHEYMLYFWIRNVQTKQSAIKFILYCKINSGCGIPGIQAGGESPVCHQQRSDVNYRLIITNNL